MIEKLYSEVKSFIVRVYRSIFRHGYPMTPKERQEAMVDNFFFHIHPAKVNRNTLRPRYTLGLGLISFYLFLILTVTGILLMFYYVPSVERAYGSMKDLEFVVTFGRIIRNMHRWAAHAMVAFVFLHMCRVFYTASYKTPREFNWVIGVTLFLLTLFLSFTGYLLPWDQLAFWAITVGSNIAGYVPVVGDKIKFLLLGGNIVGQNALLRFYVLHVVLLPLVASILLGIHFWRIRKDGGLSRPPKSVQGSSDNSNIFPRSPNKTYGLMALVKGTSVQVDREPEDEVPSWPNLIFRELIVFMGVLFVLIVISYFFNAPLEEIANPVHPPNPAKAPWYFLGLQELVSYSAFLGGVVIPFLVVLYLLLIPYIDKNPKGVGIWFSKDRKLAICIFTIFVIAAVAFTLIGMYFRGTNWGWVWPWHYTQH